MAIDQTGVSEGRYIAYWSLCFVKQRRSAESTRTVSSSDDSQPAAAQQRPSRSVTCLLRTAAAQE